MVQHNLYHNIPDTLEVFEAGPHYIILQSDNDGVIDKQPVLFPKNKIEVLDTDLVQMLNENYNMASESLMGVMAMEGYGADISLLVFELDKHPMLYHNTPLIDAWKAVEGDINTQGYMSEAVSETLWETLDVELALSYDCFDFNLVWVDQFNDWDYDEQQLTLKELHLTEAEAVQYFDVDLAEEE